MLLFRFSRLSSTFVDIGIQMKQLNDRKQFNKAISLFNLQKQATPLTINQALKACIHLNDFQRGKMIHRDLSPFLLNNNFIRTNLIRLYMKCNDIDKAKEIFSTTTKKTIVMYNTMLDGLGENNRGKEALKIFEKISIPPNDYTYSILFKICAQLSDDQSFEFGQTVWKKMSINDRKNPIISTTFLQMLIKHENISICEQFFSKIPKNNITFTTMMKGYLKHKMAEKALDLFLNINKPDEITTTIFFNACAKLKDTKTLILAQKIFSQLSLEFRQSHLLLQSVFNMFCQCNDIFNAEIIFDKIDRNVIDYGSLMKAYNDQNQSEKTLELYERMKQENIQGNSIIFVLLINACSQIHFLSLCHSIVKQIPYSLMNDRWIQTSLGKSGSSEEAQKIFYQINEPNSISYSAIIHAYGFNGKGKEAIELFDRIPLEMIDNWIYVCVLNACSHSGLIEQSERIFNIIPQNQRTEKIYTTMIDGFARSFQFDRAQRLIDEFEKDNSPSIHMYMTMLSSARNKKDAYLSQKIFDRIRLLFNDEKSLSSATVLLANTYGLSGDFDRTSELRMKMSESGIKKIPGRSSTIVNGKLVHFHANDRSHPLSNEIYRQLGQLENELVQHGYQCDQSWISRPLNHDETNESVLWGHSERIAIAFQLIQEPKPSLIQIVTNLRICGDCHTAIKMIAQIHQCLIIIHDANRIHYFDSTGKCSCDDRF